MEVLKGVEMIRGMGRESNIYVVDSEIIVDTGTGKTFADSRKEIKERCDPKTIHTIINTHYHFDTSGGSKKFRDWLGAALLSHAEDRERIEAGDTLAEKFGDTAKIVTVDGTLKEGSVVRTSNFSFVVLHTPGHTPGSICLYEPDKKILLSGDTLLADSVGRFDLPGSNRLDLMRSLEKLLNYNIDYLLPGHGDYRKGGIGFHVKKMLNSPKQCEYV